jgi:tetratricopeptide (TPR) repeat protein
LLNPSGVLMLVVLTALPVPARGEKYNEDLEVLQKRLARRPDDVDTRLQLATVLSWRGDRLHSRQEAQLVIQQAPRYWDAHILLARLDAWDGHYGPARARLQQILQQLPTHQPALMLLADVETWDQHPGEAQRLLEKLLQREKSAEVYYRLARVAMLRFHTLQAYLLTRQALKLNPVNKEVLDFQKRIVLVSVDLAYQGEVSTGDEIQQAHSEILTVSALPRSFLSLVLLHELHYRYNTINNRLLLQADWRITRQITLSLMGGAGFPAQVIPEATGSFRLALPLLSRWDMAVGYIYDYLPQKSHLHRIRLDNGFKLPHDFRLEAAYIAGVLVEKDVGDLHGLHLRAYWRPEWIEIYLQYAYGMELYYPTPYYALWNPFKRLTSHLMGFQVMGNLGQRFTLRGGYDFELRSNETKAHLFHLAGRLWF